MTGHLATSLRGEQRSGLPAWTHHSPSLTELEKKAPFAEPCAPGPQPSLAEFFARLEAELALFHLESLVPAQSHAAGRSACQEHPSIL
jgi:hypothetical protein